MVLLMERLSVLLMAKQWVLLSESQMVRSLGQLLALRMVQSLEPLTVRQWELLSESLLVRL